MQNILKGCLTNCEWIDVQNICKKLNLSTLYIDDEANVSIDYISSQIKAITQKQQKSFLIIIDYLQLIQYNLNNRGTRAQELTQITRQLKLLAKKFNYPFIILSQLNRNIENRINKRPLLSDLRESGCINIHSIIYNHVLYKVVNIRKKKLAILSP